MPMVYFVSIVHALTCIFIVLFILLQDPKGGVLGTLGGGGGSKALFGSDGASPFLVNVTKWLAILFASSSFYLSYMSSKTNSVIDKVEVEQNIPQPTETTPKKSDDSTNSKKPESANETAPSENSGITDKAEKSETQETDNPSK